MGDSLSLECSDAVSCAPAPYAPYALHWAGIGGLAGRGRLKAPHIALPGYHNDSQELKVLRVPSESLRNFRLSIALLHPTPTRVFQRRFQRTYHPKLAH